MPTWGSVDPRHQNDALVILEFMVVLVELVSKAREVRICFDEPERVLPYVRRGRRWVACCVGFPARATTLTSPTSRCCSLGCLNRGCGSAACWQSVINQRVRKQPSSCPVGGDGCGVDLPYRRGFLRTAHAHRKGGGRCRYIYACGVTLGRAWTVGCYAHPLATYNAVL